MTRPQDHLAEQGRVPDQVRSDVADNPHDSQTRLDGLQARLERLPVNHPSSPYRDDGSRRPPPPDLAKCELPLPDEHGEREGDLAAHIEPFADSEYAANVEQAQDRLTQARAEGRTTDERYTEPGTDREIWLSDRQKVHDAIIDDLYRRADAVPNEHQAIIAGGLPAAGKSTILDHHPGLDRSQYLTIDPDEIKMEMAKRNLIPEIEGLSPMEASDLAHEESSHIAKALARRAQADGKNVLWDITMSSQASTEQRIEDLRAAGYTRIEGIFVDVPIEVSEVRAAARHRAGQEAYRAGIGEGGRLIPPEVIRAMADPEWGSTNRRAFEEVKHLLNAWSLYDNSVDERPATLIDSYDDRRPHGR